MCRVTTMVLRIVWATRQRNVRLGIAAQVFVAAGTILLYIINLIFAQRLIRAQHPRLGWHKAFKAVFALLYVAIVLTLALLIAANIQSFFTLNSTIHHIDRIIQLYGLTFFAAVSFLPIVLVILGFAIPRRARLEKFGSGRFRIKIFVLVSASVLLCLGASWRAATSWLPPVPRTQSPWYFSKACFYIFDFAVEVLVVLLYAILRVDRRFYVPNGAKGAGSYAGFKRSNSKLGGQSAFRFYTEEELFDDAATLAESLRYPTTSLQLDDQSGKWQLKRESAASLYTSYTNRSSRYTASNVDVASRYTASNVDVTRYSHAASRADAASVYQHV